MESEEMETFWFLRLPFRRAFWLWLQLQFSLGHSHPFDSNYNLDYDSIASENQP